MNKTEGCIFSSAPNRRAVQGFSLMIPTCIHSNVTASPANFSFFLVFCFFFFLSLCLLKMRRGVGMLALMDYLRILSCFVFVFSCTNLCMYHFRFMTHRISVLIENALIRSVFMPYNREK